jgi:glycosyltransferase involved in cell wall biosynthesis
MSSKLRHWVLHDYLQVNGGAERLVITLTRGLNGFGLGVSGIYPDFSGTGSVDGLHCEVTSLKGFRLPRIPRALLAFSLGTKFIALADRVIYSGFYAPLAAKRQIGGKRIYYCHTLPRFAFDRQDEYVNRAAWPLRFFLRLAIDYYRRVYLYSLRSMDVIVVNSDHVRERVLALTKLESQVVYPPIATDKFKYISDSGYYLSVARLEPAKRVDRVIEAFLQMPERNLVVASGGSQIKALQALAHGAPNIRFTDWIDDDELSDLMGRATAVIYIPADEDFGMSAVEAMSAGKPVIGVAAGGLTETIIDGETGVLLDPDASPNEIATAVRHLSSDVALQMRAACERRAEKFSNERFLASFESLLS